jgi:hypothetical protein
MHAEIINLFFYLVTPVASLAGVLSPGFFLIAGKKDYIYLL